MTTQVMQTTLCEMAAKYEPVPRYLSANSLPEMIADYVEVYRWFLRGRPLARLIYKLNIRGDLEEARDLAGELQSEQDFISETEDMLNLLESIGVIQLSSMARLERLQGVARELADKKKLTMDKERSRIDSTTLIMPG